jgi:hypothetical protein
VAAAAGCTLEPVTTPKELGTEAGEADKIVGYRFVVVPPTQNFFGSRSSRPTAITNPAANFTGTGSIVMERPIGNPGVVRVPQAEPSQHTAVIPATPAVSVVETIASLPNAIGKPDAPSVRIYALGSVIRGTPDEMKEKQVGVMTLVEEALQRAELSSEHTDLSFHSATKTLIVKANAAQHDIIDQIIRALKENETAEAASSAVGR